MERGGRYSEKRSSDGSSKLGYVFYMIVLFHKAVRAGTVTGFTYLHFAIAVVVLSHAMYKLGVREERRNNWF